VREQKASSLRRKINVNVADPHDLTSPFKLSVSGEGYDASKTDGAHAWVDVSPLGVDSGFFGALGQDATLLRDPGESFNPSARTSDYCFPCVHRRDGKAHHPPTRIHLDAAPRYPGVQ